MSSLASKFCAVIKQSLIQSNGYPVAIIKSKEGVFHVGFGLTVANVNAGGPLGCRTFYDEEDAIAEFEVMTTPGMYINHKGCI